MAERYSFDLAHNPVEEVNKKERFHRNYAAISVLKECQNENRFATPEEQIILSKYVGWGTVFPKHLMSEPVLGRANTQCLKSILTPEEYAAARESTLTAFYTPPEVITAIYKAMEKMGFKEGNLLEPSCGIGNFIGMLPKSMENAKVYGVELDTISAGIAQQLYQKSSIAAQGFEEVNVPDSFFDGVIGNVPFGDFKVSDKRYDKYNFLIHDYFFAKSLDKLRPGGVMALVTSKGTMDKENSSVRKYIAQRAELLGAIRLPNNTFKGNAGTEVVSDILFLQKRDRMIDIEPDWIHLDTDENGIKMNSYFVQHPEMILGEMKMVSGRFGPEATCEAFENADLGELLNEAVINIHGEISEYEVADELDEEDNSIPADPTVRNFSYTVLDDKIYFRENSRMSPAIVSATAENRIKGMVAIRDSVRNLIELQTEDYPDSEVKFIHEADTDIKKERTVPKDPQGRSQSLAWLYSEDGSRHECSGQTYRTSRCGLSVETVGIWSSVSGRIIRQGNSNPDVDIYRYVTEQTFDAYLYQLVEGKQKFASQIMTSKSPVRSAEDIDETALSYAEIKMLATGNPYIKEKMDLDIQVQKLKLLKSNFLSEKYRLEDKIIKYYPQQITSLQNKIEGLKQDVETAKRNPKPTDDHFVGMEVKGVFYSAKSRSRQSNH